MRSATPTPGHRPCVRRIPWLVGGCLVALLVSTVSPAAAQPAWTGVLTTVSDESGGPIDLAGDAAGNAIAIWEALPTSAIRVAHFSAVTKAWAAPLVLQAGGRQPDIAMNLGGDAVAVWVAVSGSQYLIRSAVYRPGSATWSAPVTIASAGNSPQLAVDAHGNATAIWEAPGPSYQSHVQAARYSAATGVWSATVDVTPVAYNGGSAAPRIVLDSSEHATAVFWTGDPRTPGARGLYASRWSTSSPSWSRPQLLRPGDGSMPPAITVDPAGKIFVVWRTTDGTAAVAAARYVAATDTWSTWTFADLGYDHEVEVVADDAGNAMAAWVGQSEGFSAFLSTTYSSSSETWSTPQPIPGARSGAGLGLAVDGTGTITAVWGSGSTRYAVRRVSGQPWTAPVTLLENGAGSSLAAASASGDVTVLWSDLRSTRWASTGAEVVSAPTRLTVTTPRIWYGRAEVGAPLTISWSAPQTGLPVTGYRLEAGSSPGASDLAVLDVGAVTQVVTTVPALPRVDLRVRTISGATVGPPSAETGFIVHGVCSAPSLPSGLTSTVSGSTVDFTWQAASGAVSYVLEAGTAPGLANLVSTSAGGATRFSATAPPGTYYVRVRAANYCATSGTSNEVVVTIGGAAAPGAPVLNTPMVSGNTVSLSWSAGGGGAPTGYTLTASMTPGGAPVATVPLSGGSASFPGVPPGTYHLRLTASNAAGVSPPSAQMTVRVP